MNIRGWVLGFLVVALAVPAAAFSPVAYPGSTWGHLNRDLDGIEGNGTLGKVQQGVRWITLPYKIQLETFAAYRWRLRSQNRRFFNAHGPAVVLQMSRSAFDLGFDFHWSRFPERDRTFKNFEFFLKWYKRWNIARILGFKRLAGVPIVAMPLSTWGELAHDLEDVEGDSSMGWVTQGIHWFKLPGGFTFDTFVAYRWRVRTERKRFFNAYGPAVGVEFDNGPLRLGVDHTWKKFPQLGTLDKTFRLYMIWYTAWNLKAVKS